jgi:DNA primase
LLRTTASRVFAALAAAWHYYTCDPLHERGVGYLVRRGIDVGLLENYTRRPEVGHTPARTNGLVTAMRDKGFSNDELVDAGLASRRRDSSTVSDFYRQRVLIPVRGDQGRVCGFVGRNVGDDRWPKYKNPPRTHAYDKSVNLYQLLPAPIDARGQVVVVEGTVDAMAIAVAAIRSGKVSLFCPVTQSGRELSPCQLDYVLSLHPFPPVIAFDGDAAGRESSVRVALAATRKGIEVTVATLPDGHDQATWLADYGPAGLVAWTRTGRCDSRSRSCPQLVPAGRLDTGGQANSEGLTERGAISRRRQLPAGERALSDTGSVTSERLAVPGI